VCAKSTGRPSALDVARKYLEMGVVIGHFRPLRSTGRQVSIVTDSKVRQSLSRIRRTVETKIAPVVVSLDAGVAMVVLNPKR
jgi:hypothetical protein